ncbi:divalent cation tolerance protein CutA [Sodalis sp. RH15]|uniref:divalent cation tolerance protein CutA n=1 Tax=Sodalis sp. RH15 TaxID=3394330 RepID=UPI0039B48F0C
MAAHSPDRTHPAVQPISPGHPGSAAPGNVVVLCTAPDEAAARDLAAKLLDNKLAACVTMLPGALSLYRWEGELEQQQEVQMLIKSHTRHQQELITLIKTHHPYETPELLVLPVLGGDADYLSWLNASLR